MASTRYAPADWHTANTVIATSAERQRGATHDIRQQSYRLRNETGETNTKNWTTEWPYLVGMGVCCYTPVATIALHVYYTCTCVYMYLLYPGSQYFVLACHQLLTFFIPHNIDTFRVKVSMLTIIGYIYTCTCILKNHYWIELAWFF